MPASSSVPAPTPAQSLREYGRGVLGGLLLSLPLLYTMEVWWAGMSRSPMRLLAGLAATFAMLLLYNRYAGLRPSSSWREVAVDSVEELGLGVLVSTLVLWLVGQVDASMPLAEVVGKVAVETMAVAVGVSVGTAQFGAAADAGGMADEPDGARSAFASDAALALCGAFLVAANIAPTDEIVDIATGATPAQLTGLVAAALVVSVGAVAIRTADLPTRPVDALREGVIACAIALLTAAALLAYGGRFDGASLSSAAALVAVLGLPTALGAGAGRVLVEGGIGGGTGEGSDDRSDDGADATADGADPASAASRSSRSPAASP